MKELHRRLSTGFWMRLSIPVIHVMYWVIIKWYDCIWTWLPTKALLHEGLEYYYRKGSTYFWPIFPFYTPWKHEKTKIFLVFSGGIKWEHSPEMGYEKTISGRLKIENLWTSYRLYLTHATVTNLLRHFLKLQTRSLSANAIFPKLY